MIRQFHIVAIPIRIVVNRFGDHNPNGRIYVLKENESLVKKKVELNPYTPVDLVEPLVIRANVGDEIEILFENKLPFNTSMHIQNAEYDVLTSDGAFVGLNNIFGKNYQRNLYYSQQGLNFVGGVSFSF